MIEDFVKLTKRPEILLNSSRVFSMILILVVVAEPKRKTSFRIKEVGDFNIFQNA